MILLLAKFMRLIFLVIVWQKKMEQMGDLIKRLKNCVRWFKRVEEGYIQEKEKLQTDLESAEKKCIDTGEPFSTSLFTLLSIF